MSESTTIIAFDQHAQSRNVSFVSRAVALTWAPHYAARE